MIKTRFILPDIFVVDDIFRYAAVLRGFFDGVGFCQSFGDVHVHMLDNRQRSPRRILHTALDCSREDAVRYILHIALHTKSEEVQDA